MENAAIVFETEPTKVGKIILYDINGNFINNAVPLIYQILVLQGNTPEGSIEFTNVTTESLKKYTVTVINSNGEKSIVVVVNTPDLQKLLDTLNILFELSIENSEIKIKLRRVGPKVIIRNNYGLFILNPLFLESLNDASFLLTETPVIANLLIMIDTFNIFRSTVVARNSTAMSVMTRINDAIAIIGSELRNKLNSYYTLLKIQSDKKIKEKTITEIKTETNNNEEMEFINLILEIKENEININLNNKILNFLYLWRKSQIIKVINKFNDQMKFNIWNFLRLNNNNNKYENEIQEEIKNSLLYNTIEAGVNNTFILVPIEFNPLDNVETPEQEFTKNVLKTYEKNKKKSENIIDLEEEEEEEEKEDTLEQEILANTENKILAETYALTGAILATAKASGFPDDFNLNIDIANSIFARVSNEFDFGNYFNDFTFGPIPELETLALGTLAAEAGQNIYNFALSGAFGALTATITIAASYVTYHVFSYVFSYLYSVYKGTVTNPGLIAAGFMPFVSNEVASAQALDALVSCVEGFKYLTSNTQNILLTLDKNNWFEPFVIIAIDSMLLWRLPTLRTTWRGLGTLVATAYAYELIIRPDGSIVDTVHNLAGASYDASIAVTQGLKVGSKFVGSLGVLISLMLLGGVAYIGYKVYNKTQGKADSLVEVKLID